MIPDSLSPWFLFSAGIFFFSQILYALISLLIQNEVDDSKDGPDNNKDSHLDSMEEVSEDEDELDLEDNKPVEADTVSLMSFYYLVQTV